MVLRRFFMRATARWVMSMPIHWRLSFWAAAMAVPQPQKGSSTTSPSFEDAWTMRSKQRQAASGSCIPEALRTMPRVLNWDI